MKTAYGIGYTGRRVDDLKRIIAELDAYLVDIRFAPTSRNPAYRKKALENAFGDRYVHIHAFGNRNYKSGPIDIVDYDAGKAALEALDKPAVLMCMCKDPATCHRTTVLARLAEDGFDTQEWQDDEEGDNAKQLPLW